MGMTTHFPRLAVPEAAAAPTLAKGVTLYAVGWHRDEWSLITATVIGVTQGHVTLNVPTWPYDRVRARRRCVMNKRAVCVTGDLSPGIGWWSTPAEAWQDATETAAHALRAAQAKLDALEKASPRL